MNLFGSTFVKSLNKKSYCLVIIDDYSRFTWVFFLATKDETTPILKTFITGLENQLSLKVKVIRSDNGIGFKNSDLHQFGGLKGIKREFSAETVNTACYVQNRVLVTKPHNKTPYELLHGRTSSFQDNFDAEKAGEEVDQSYMLFPKPESKIILSPSSSAQSKEQDDKTKKEAKGKSPVEYVARYRDLNAEFEDCFENSSNEVNTASSTIPTVGKISLNSTNTFSAAGPSNYVVSPIYGKTSDIDASQLPDDPDMPKLEDIIYSDNEDVIGAEAEFNNLESSIPKEPKRVHQALKDPSWIEAMNKKDERGIVIRNKARLVAQGHTHEEGIDYEEVFAQVARIEAIRLFLAYASFMGFMVYKMDVKSAILYGTIKEEVGKIDQTLFIKKQEGDILLVQIYVDDIIFGATNKDLCRSFEKLMKDKFQMSSMRELTFFLGLLVKQKKDGIFISQDKYVAEILRNFGLTKGKSASTPIDTEKPLLKDPDVCACAHFQVTPKASHLYSVKRIFRYLKGKPHLGLWYLKDSPFDLVAYSDSDYAGASLDRKYTTRGCQFLGCILISWLCKKQTVIATSSTESEYVTAASCYAQVLWIQN
nr:hypothetical protein [Tanacetum cinerariifolium]